MPNLSRDEADKIDSFLKLTALVPVDSRLARNAGQLRRLFGLKTADSAIAATALLTGSALLTRNIKDFRKIPSLNLQQI